MSARTQAAFPPLIYLSQRLMLDRYNAAQAKGSRWSLNQFSAGAGPVQAGASKGPVDPDNPYMLVRRVTKSLAPTTGTLKQPAQYVRATIAGYWAELRSFGAAPPAAWFAAPGSDERGLPAVTLCGSLSNCLARLPESDEYRGWFPSTLYGMRNLVKACAQELYDRDVVATQLDSGIETDQDLASEALRIAPIVGQGWHFADGTFDVFFEVFRDVTIPTSDGRTSRVLLGAPLWATVLTESQTQIK